MSQITVLNLDLDWFNFLPKCRVLPFTRKFFSELHSKCFLPPSVMLMEEHQYVYPWCLSLMRNCRAKQVEIINVDQHHDFYIDGLCNPDDDYSSITCANFFAFMAHENLISKYTWVCDAGHTGAVVTQRADIVRCIKDSCSRKVRNFRKNIFVRRRQRAIEILSGKRIDGFAIIKSPDYTNHAELIFSSVENILTQKPNWCELKIHKKTSDFYKFELNNTLGLLPHDLQYLSTPM